MSVCPFTAATWLRKAGLRIQYRRKYGLTFPGYPRRSPERRPHGRDARGSASHEQVRKLLASLDGTEVPARDRAILLLLATYGVPSQAARAIRRAKGGRAGHR